jgi:hypothetical protein
MYVLDRSVELLLEAIRSSALSSLADDIEAHLQAGKLPLFDRKQNQSADLEAKRLSALVARDRRSSAPVEVSPTDEDLSAPYTPDEQIEEALRLIRERLQATVEITEDISRITGSLGVPAIELVYVTNETAEPLVTEGRAAETLHRWDDIASQVHTWMNSQRSAATPDAE